MKEQEHQVALQMESFGKNSSFDFSGVEGEPEAGCNAKISLNLGSISDLGGVLRCSACFGSMLRTDGFRDGDPDILQALIYPYVIVRTNP